MSAAPEPSTVLRFAVCEDEPVFLRDVEAALEREMARRGIAYVLSRHRDAESFLASFAPGAVDIALLDVALPGLDGLELARRIRRDDDDCVIVFITSSPDHAVAGYEVAAAGYLLKPLDGERFAATLDRCLGAAASRRHFVVFATAHGERRVSPARITHVESRVRRTLIHTLDGDFAVNAKLEEALARLPERFIRVHKSFAVNPDLVTRRNAGVMVAEGGRAVPVSRAFRKEAEARYLAYLARGL